jgi:hypothetical protein
MPAKMLLVNPLTSPLRGLSSGEPKKCILAGILGCPPVGYLSTVQYAFLKTYKRKREEHSECFSLTNCEEIYE